MAVNIGPKIGIDGEAKYRSELNKIIQQQKTLQAEMNAVTSSFTKNTTAEEKNAAVSKILSEQVKIQRERVEQLSAMLQKSAEKYGENDTKTLKWKEAVNSATAELNKMENQLKESSDATDDLGDSLDESQEAAFSFGDALKANVLSQAIVDGFKKLVSLAKETSGEFIEAAASVKAETSQFEQTFKEFGDQAEDAIGRVSENAGILDTRLKTVGAQIYAFAKSSGGDAAGSLELMEKALQATADSAAYYDRSLEDTAESLQSFLKGNYANDAALGLSATETTRNAAAMELFGQKFNDLTEIQKQQTLLQMVLDAQELSGAMGQAAREADGWENVQGNLNEAWSQFQAQAGDPFLENLIPIIKDATEGLQDFSKSVDWNSFADGVDDTFRELTDIGEKAFDLGKKTLPEFGKGVKFVADNFESLSSVAIATYTSIKVFKGISAVTSTITGFQKTLKTAAGTMTLADKAMKLLNLSMSANVFGAVAISVAALVGGIAALVAIEGQAKTAYEEEAEAAKKAAEVSKERLEAYQDQLEASEQQAIADTTQIEYTRDLWEELQKLADESGNVDEKNRSRAEFILGELNEALGTEYELTGNQIQNYQDMADAIDTVIEKKQAQILLDAYEDDYKDAIKTRTELEKEQVDVERELNQIREELSNKTEEYAKKSEELTRQMSSGSRNIDASLSNEARILRKEIDALEENLKSKESIYNDNEQLLREKYTMIEKWEGASVAFLEGNSQEVVDILNSTNSAQVLANQNLAENAEEQANILKQSYEDATIYFEQTLQRYQEGVDGITSETLLDAYKTLSQAKQTYYDNLSQSSSETTQQLKRDAEETENVLIWENQKFIEYSDLMGKTHNEVKDILKKQSDDATAYLDQLITDWNDGVGDITSDTLLQAYKLAESAKEEYQKVGGSMMEGVAQGIQDASGLVYQMVNRTMAGAIVAAKSAIDSNSPSKKFADLVGATIPTGIAKGIRDNISALEKTTNWMMGYTFPKSNSKIATAIGGMSSAGYANTQNTMNATYNMTVNGVAGQDINALSNIIMRKIQSATERKGSIWK